VVVTHAAALVAELETAAAVRRIVLEKRLGETLIEDDHRPGWAWPSR
jgi:hypothetical protein